MAREEKVFMAKVAEQAERYHEMLALMCEVVQLGAVLSVEERNLFSVAWKNVTGARRASLRMLNERKHPHAADYCARIEAELDELCSQCLATLTATLLPAHAHHAESLVFLHKMAGDYNRYRCEYLKDNERTAAVDEARRHYGIAMEVAERELSPAHPVRLGVVLNYSVHVFEVEKDPERSHALSRTAFDAAIPFLDALDEPTFKDSSLIMTVRVWWVVDAPALTVHQLLRDVILWHHGD